MGDNDYMEMILARYRAIRAELDALYSQHSSIVEQMAAKQEVAKHLSGLLAAEGHPVNDAQAIRQGQVRPVDLAFERLDRQQDGYSAVHYTQLASEVISNGGIIPGKNPAATLLAQISRDGRFVRVGPGSYALSKWKGKLRASARTGKRRKKR